MNLVIYLDADLAAQRLVRVFGLLTSALAGRRECTNVAIMRSSRFKPTDRLGGGGISSVLGTDRYAGRLSSLSIRLTKHFTN
jgi:hypothetical protein